MKRLIFTVDDNIRFLKEINEGAMKSIFDHPYPAMYKRLNEKFGLKVQLNLFYKMDGFDLSMMSDRYKEEWKKESDWLKLSFHSLYENTSPYESSGYDEVFSDASNVHSEILRFASKKSLAATTTIHYCRLTEDGLRAMKDAGVKGLLGLYDNRSSYDSTYEECERLSRGEAIQRGGMTYMAIDSILNNLSDASECEAVARSFSDRDTVKLMIHEQYFYPDYVRYLHDFEQRIEAPVGLLCDCGFTPVHFEDVI